MNDLTRYGWSRYIAEQDAAILMAEKDAEIERLRDEVAAFKSKIKATTDYSREVFALREALEKAYKEGFNKGFSEGMVEAKPYSNGGLSANDCWPNSKAKQSLAATAHAQPQPRSTFTCPACCELSDLGDCDVHAGTVFACSHCGAQSVIEPVAVDKPAQSDTCGKNPMDSWPEWKRTLALTGKMTKPAQCGKWE